MKRKTIQKKTDPVAPVVLPSEKETISRNEMISLLLKTPHRDLNSYLPVGSRAVREDPEFFSHLIAWNQKKGEVRDSKVGLPVLALSKPDLEPEYVENAYAHLALLAPRDLVRACRFLRALKLTAKRRKGLDQLVRWYLQEREKNWARWVGAAVQDRASMKTLYKMAKYAGTALASQILFDKEYPEGSVFEAIKNLSSLSPEEAAGKVMEFKIPFLVLPVAVGKNLKTDAMLLALIKAMSPAELTTNVKMLNKWGVQSSPALRAAYEEGLRKVASSKKPNLKIGRAIEAVEAAGDEKTKEVLKHVQEKQLSKTMSIEGDWLILADKSGSMNQSIQVAREVAATLAKQVRGKVHLLFFDTAVRYFDVSGQSLADIQKTTKTITANGGTQMQVGLQYAMTNKLSFDGIAVISDGGDYGHSFGSTYQTLTSNRGVEIPVYFYRVTGEDDRFSKQMTGQPLETFDLHNGIDFNSLPNLVSTMRTNRFSLSDEILETKLLNYRDVFTIDLEKPHAKKKGNHQHAGSNSSV